MKNGPKDNHSPPLPPTYLESITFNGALAKGEANQDLEGAYLHVHSIRKRLADTEGISAKAVVDSIVKAGILRNDTTQEVEQVTYSQEKGTEEVTIITVRWE